MVRRFVSGFPWRLARAVCIVLAIVGMSAVGVFGAITNMTSPRVIAPGASNPFAVATPTAPAPVAETRKLPCKQQSWPMIDRSCESWTADARKAEPPAPEPVGAAPQQQATPVVPPPAAAPQPIKVAVPAEQPKRTAAIEAPKVEPPKPAPAVIAAAPKAEPPKNEPAKVEPPKIEPAKVEPAKVEPAKIASKDPIKTEPKVKLADNVASAPASAKPRRNATPANAVPASTVPASTVPAPFPIREFLAARR